MLTIHFSEFNSDYYKNALSQATAELMQNPNFVLKKPVCLTDSYYQGAPLPQIIVDRVNEVIGNYGFTPPLDYYSMSFLISDLIYEAWIHKDENWDDYCVIYGYIVNGQPYVFRYTHPTMEELAAYQSKWIDECYVLIRLYVEEEYGIELIENVIAHYTMGDIFDTYFNGDIENLPPYLDDNMNEDASDRWLGRLNGCTGVYSHK